MPPMNLRWTFWGRPLKPMALALGISMVVLWWSGYTDSGILRESTWGDITGAFGLVITGVMTSAWIVRSQRLAEWAMLGAFFVWAVRLWALAITIVVNQGRYTEALGMAFAFTIAAGGSWLLERDDTSGRV